MSYQVLARKWRPQRFDDVIGQRGVTQTLRNAIAAGRIAQSFVFAGPRGVGKTTTARILARALNCQTGPTADPCGTCDACVEIAQGRDIDVIEIDAATNTQVANVRQVIVEGLGVAPARDRFKIFIIDEVHRLSGSAFDALLKSIEEPPPHVVFMMATTELDKVPPTIQSRSQLFELKTIGMMPIHDQLRKIATAEKIAIDDAALILIARAGDGSMRDAESAFDQVIAFAGEHISAEDVSTVLGLVQRDLLFDIADAVVREEGAAAFDLAGRAVESGYDLRSVVRELARLTRDLLVVKLDPSRAADPEIAADAERERLVALSTRFSSEDLMRAFDVLTKAELDIRGSAHPRYHLEMALLRWIHLRKLVPISDLIQGLRQSPDVRRQSSVASRQSSVASRGSGSPQSPVASGQPPGMPLPAAGGQADAELFPRAAAPGPRPPSATAAMVSAVEAGKDAVKEPIAAGNLKNAFLDEIRKTKKYFYGAVVGQARRIDVEPNRIVFAFAPEDRTLRAQLDQLRAELETVAGALAGRKITVVSVEIGGAAPVAPGGNGTPTAPAQDRQAELRQQALSDSGVQAMLDVFAAEIKDVEEMDK